MRMCRSYGGRSNRMWWGLWRGRESGSTVNFLPLFGSLILPDPIKLVVWVTKLSRYQFTLPIYMMHLYALLICNIWYSLGFWYADHKQHIIFSLTHLYHCLFVYIYIGLGSCKTGPFLWDLWKILNVYNKNIMKFPLQCAFIWSHGWVIHDLYYVGYVHGHTNNWNYFLVSMYVRMCISEQITCMHMCTLLK